MPMLWIESAGRPLIVLEDNLRSCWTGCFSPVETASDVKDYERACAVDNYLGLIGVAAGYRLVLGNESMRTTWLPGGANAGLLVRWQWANAGEDVIKAINGLVDLEWAEPSLVFPVSGSGLLLFGCCVRWR